MSRRVQNWVVFLLVALVPMRAAASVAADSHAAGHHTATVHAHDSGDREAAQRHGDENPGDEIPGCSHGAGHCAGTTFIAPSNGAPFPVAANAAPIPFGKQLASGFVPEHLDRPPLAL